MHVTVSSSSPLLFSFINKSWIFWLLFCSGLCLSICKTVRVDVLCGRSLAWSRTSACHADDPGSNLGDRTKTFSNKKESWEKYLIAKIAYTSCMSLNSGIGVDLYSFYGCFLHFCCPWNEMCVLCEFF